MSDNIIKTNKSFLSYVKEIEREIYTITNNIDQLSDDDLTDSTYVNLSHHFDHIQTLFDTSSETAKQLTLNQSNPDLYNILEAKSKLSNLYGTLNRLRNSFTKRYQKLRGNSSEIDNELTHERSFEPVISIPESDDVSDDSQFEESDIDFDEELEELLILEEEQELEKAERANRQKRLAEDARKKEQRRHNEERIKEERLSEERLRQHGMQVRDGKQYSEADIRNEQIRQEEERLRIARENSERIARNNEVFEEYQRRQEASLQFERLDKSHIDYSKDLSGSSNPEPTVYNFTPFGTVPVNISPTVQHSDDETIMNNAKIYSSLMKSEQFTSDSDSGPIIISPAYENQMKFNLEMARTEYYEARGTPKEKEAAHKFMEQRAAYSELSSDLRNGRIKFDEPVAVPYSEERKKETSSVPPPQMFYSYTPSGVVGSAVDNGRLSNHTYTYTNPGLRNNTIYTPETPLKVTPKYESQLYDRMKAATTVMNNVVEHNAKGTTAPVSPAVYSELKVATDAYLGFRRAKAAGSVIVSQDAEKSVPDYRMWQQQYNVGNSRVNVSKILGSTVQQRQINQNKVSKDVVEEVSSSILTRDSKLKRESVSQQYFKAVGYKVSGYSSYAMTTFSRKIYQLVQTGDDNALRTMETGRYYLSTGIAVGRAIHNSAPIKSTAGSAAELAKWEFKRFGTLTSLDNKTISGQMNSHIQAARELKKEIKTYTEGNRILSEKERLQLTELKYDHRKLTAQISKEASLLKYRHQNELKLQLSNSLKEEHKGFVSIKHVDAKMQELQREAYKEMRAKFGHLTSNTDRSFKLLKATDRSLAKEITELKSQANKLKSQIKILQNKGSALNAAERVRLKSLMTEHKSLSESLRKLIGLQKARGLLNEKLDALSSLRKDMIQNRNAWSGGYYALQHLVLKPIFEGSDIGAMGLAHGIRFATNRHIRKLIKNGIKASVFLTKTSMELIAPGTVQAMSNTFNVAKTAVNAQVAVTKKAIKTAVKTTVQTAAQATKQAALRLTPPKIKTAVSHGVNQGRLLSTSFKNLTASARKKFAESTIGRGIAAVRRTVSNATAALKAVFSVISSIITKVLIIFVCVFLVVGVVTAFMTAFAGSATSSIILSPYESDDGRISLLPYVEILQDAQVDYDADIDLLLDSSDYEKVVVKNGTSLLNNYKDILCMTAVKMDQDLDLDTNEEVENYLLHLFDISHTYTTQEVYWEHNPGCEEKITRTEVKTYCTGCIIASNGMPDCKGHISYEEKKEYYCPGHLDLYITKYILTMDEIMDYENSGNAIYGGIGIGSFDSSLGGVSAKYEAGGINPGMISTGAGDHGGKSYGTWQLSSSVGSLRSFVNWLRGQNTEIYNILSSHELASSGFDEAWTSIATNQYELFQELQATYIYNTYCAPYIARVKDYYGVDLSRSKALTELAFSTSVQFGPGAVSVLGKIKSDMSDEEIIKTCYAYKRNNVATLFASSSTKIQNSLKTNRFVTEEQDLLSLINTSYDSEETDPDKEDSDTESGEFWTDDKRDWAHILYNQDWVELYDVYFSPASGSMMDPMTAAQIETIIAECKEDYPELGADRERAIRTALSLVGKVQYYWGGGHEANLQPGWNDKWGTPAPPSSSPTTTYTTWGLDCSGFIRWVFLTSYNREVYWMTIKQMTSKNGVISKSEALPGDLANVSDGSGDYSHIGMYLYTNDEGEHVFVHSGGGLSGVSLTTGSQTGFDVYHSPHVYD